MQQNASVSHPSSERRRMNGKSGLPLDRSAGKCYGRGNDLTYRPSQRKTESVAKSQKDAGAEQWHADAVRVDHFRRGHRSSESLARCEDRRRANRHARVGLLRETDVRGRGVLSDSARARCLLRSPVSEGPEQKCSSTSAQASRCACGWPPISACPTMWQSMPSGHQS